MDRKRKRQSGLELDWTASRCQRLLRPLASRITPLRRHQYTITSQSSQKTEKEVPTNQRDINKDPDPTWLPQQGQNLQVKKYSARTRKTPLMNDASRSPQTCLVSLPTPFKARAMRRASPIKPSLDSIVNNGCMLRGLQTTKTRRSRKDPFARAPIAKQSVELQNRQNFEKIFELHQGVVDGFSLLLQRTTLTTSEDQPSKGASSLLKMCLRKVPSYIRAEEEWRKNIDEDDETDVSAEVYEELQDLSSVPGRGWPGLREVVIAHGVSLVEEMIRDKLVSTDTRKELAKMPARYGLHGESKRLCLAFAYSLPLKRPMDTGSQLFDGCLSGLSNIGFGDPFSVKNDVFVHILHDLFSSGQLNLSWLATRDMIKFSSSMIRTLAAHSQGSTNLVDLLQTQISQVLYSEFVGTLTGSESDTWKKLQDSLVNSTISIITVLTAIVLIERTNSGNESPGSSSSIAAEYLLTRLAVDALVQLRHFEKRKHYQGGLPDQPKRVGFALLTSNLILRIQQRGDGGCWMSLCKEDLLIGMLQMHELGTKTDHHSQTMIERAASFLGDLSRCCGQSLHSDSQGYLEGLVQSILLDSQEGSNMEKMLLRQLALEGSLNFAKTSASHRSRSFMEDVEAAVTHRGPLVIQSSVINDHHNLSNGIKQGLRWEEGLCEWIASTPLPATRSKQFATIRSGTGLSDSSDDEHELNDSGYMSGLETPAPRKGRVSFMPHFLASPDMLGSERSYASPSYSLEKKGDGGKLRGVLEAEHNTSDPCVDAADNDADALIQQQLAVVSCPMGPIKYHATPKATKKNSRLNKRQKKSQNSPCDEQSSQSALGGVCPGNSRETTSERPGDEVDELAMSCVKKRCVVPIARAKGGRPLGSKLARGDLFSTGRTSNGLNDDSGDELGL